MICLIRFMNTTKLITTFCRSPLTGTQKYNIYNWFSNTFTHVTCIVKLALAFQRFSLPGCRYRSEGKGGGPCGNVYISCLTFKICLKPIKNKCFVNSQGVEYFSQTLQNAIRIRLSGWAHPFVFHHLIILFPISFWASKNSEKKFEILDCQSQWVVNAKNRWVALLRS